MQKIPNIMIMWIQLLLTPMLLTLPLLTYRTPQIVWKTVHIIRRGRSVKSCFKQMMQTMQREFLRVISNGGVDIWSIGKKSTQTRGYWMENWTQWMIFCSLI